METCVSSDSLYRGTTVIGFYTFFITNKTYLANGFKESLKTQPSMNYF